MPKYVVRHGVMRTLGVFSTRGGDRYSRGQRVIARTSRGQEAGEVLCDATSHVQSQMDNPRSGQILRLLNNDDEIELRRIDEQSRDELEVCKQRVAERGLEMEMVDAERLYGGERAVFYYLAEGRIDFRELVKQLAKDCQTRIEMRQIGVRDEAKLLADYGDCGKPVCCNTHLSEMPPVSMKMAKLQKATLDPTKISGRCGRLKCCLRYEYDTYRGLQKDLPRVGSEIITGEGRAKVLAQEILASQLLVQTEDMRRRVIDVSEVLSVLPKGSPPAGGEPSASEKPPAQKNVINARQPSETAERSPSKQSQSDASANDEKRLPRRRRGRTKPAGGDAEPSAPTGSTLADPAKSEPKSGERTGVESPATESKLGDESRGGTPSDEVDNGPGTPPAP